jgi:hypothetical protein
VSDDVADEDDNDGDSDDDDDDDDDDEDDDDDGTGEKADANEEEGDEKADDAEEEDACWVSLVGTWCTGGGTKLALSGSHSMSTWRVAWAELLPLADRAILSAHGRLRRAASSNFLILSLDEHMFPPARTARMLAGWPESGLIVFPSCKTEVSYSNSLWKEVSLETI